MKFLKKNIWWFVAAGALLYLYRPWDGSDLSNLVGMPVGQGSGHVGGGATGSW